MTRPDVEPTLASVSGTDATQKRGHGASPEAAAAAAAEHAGPAFLGAHSAGHAPAEGWRMPAHETHADPLLDCLVQLTSLHGKPYTAQALSNGLPLVDQRLTPSLLARAAARAQFSTRIVQRTMDDVPQGLLPAILLLHGGRACLLLRAQEGGRVLLQYPESDSPVEVEVQALLQDYTGLMCFVRAQFRFEQRDLFGEARQHLARRRRLAWRRALQKHLAEPFLELLDALADRRWRQVQPPRRGFETALAQDGGESGELCVVEVHSENPYGVVWLEILIGI